MFSSIDQEIDSSVYEEDALTFDDVLIIPQRSSIFATDISLDARFSRRVILKSPFASAAMDKVTEVNMMIELAKLGGIGVLHRNTSIEERIRMIREARSATLDDKDDSLSNTTLSWRDKKKIATAAAIGHRAEDIDCASRFVDEGVDALVIDTAHGHHDSVLNMISKLKHKFGKDIDIIGGNIVTEIAADDMIDVGVDGVKVGVGPGSICTTRIVAGVGVPQLTAIQNVCRRCGAHDIPVIADGGIKSSGDVAKAIGAGASCVMLGSLFAATNEAPGEIIERDGKRYKYYRGMGSAAAVCNGGLSDRYLHNDSSKKFVPQGVEGLVELKGSLADALNQLEGGLRSAMSFTGSGSICEFWWRCKFVRITSKGYDESHAHSLKYVL